MFFSRFTGMSLERVGEMGSVVGGIVVKNSGERVTVPSGFGII